MKLADQTASNVDIFQKIFEMNARLYESVVKQLSNYRWGKKKTVEYRKSERLDRKTGKMIVRKIPVEVEVEDWYPLENEHGDVIPGLLSLQSSIKVAEYVQDLIGGADARVTNYPVGTRTLLMARYVSIHASLMLDNPNWDYKGTETDSAQFTSMVIVKAHAMFNSSIDGFLLRQITEATTNIYQRKVSEAPSEKEKRNQIPEILRNWNNSPQKNS